jgi:hypothetical protein
MEPLDMNMSSFLKFCLLPVILVTSLASTASAQGWTPHAGEPPAGIVPATPAYGKVHYADGTQGLVWFEMAQKKVTIRWKREAPNIQLYQSIATGYWPTAVVALGSGDEFVVSGKRRNGNTVIERWKLTKPIVNSPAIGAAYMESAIVAEIDTLYDEAHQGRDMVLRMLARPGQTNSVLVQFFDSKDLYDVSWTAASTSTTLVASASALPALQTSFTFSWSRDHKTRGIVYVFRDEDVPNSTLVLIDQDRNKTIDSAIGVTDLEWTSGDWGSGSSYFP